MAKKHIPRILLVDSEPKWRKAAKAVLEKQGKYNVESVANIEAALNFPFGNGFDLILINAALVFGENISRFEQMLSLYPDKVLVISDVRSISTAIEVFKMGADYAEKPFEPRRVIELVASRLQAAANAAQ